jgi:hypothetical protein
VASHCIGFWSKLDDESQLVFPFLHQALILEPTLVARHNPIVKFQ